MKKYALLFAVVPAAFVAQAQVSGKTTSLTVDYDYGTAADTNQIRGYGAPEAPWPEGFGGLAGETGGWFLPNAGDPALPDPEDLSEGECSEWPDALHSAASEAETATDLADHDRAPQDWPAHGDLTTAEPPPAPELLNLPVRAALFAVLGAPGVVAWVGEGETPEPELWVQAPQSAVVQADAEAETVLAPDSETDALSERYDDEAVGENPDDLEDQTSLLSTWQGVGEGKKRAEVPVHVVLAWLDALTQLRMNLWDPARAGVRNLAMVVRESGAVYDELGVVRLSTVTIEQRGDDQQARVFQEERSNSVRIFQAGQGNQAWTQQEADDSGINLAQVGQNNHVRVVQLTGFNVAELLQSGVGNGTTLTQGTELSGTGGNAFRLEQVGAANQFVAEQTGAGNLIEGLATSSRAVQEGDLNLMAVFQSGNENRFFAQQEGANGQVTASQSGNKNTASVVQQQPTP